METNLSLSKTCLHQATESILIQITKPMNGIFHDIRKLRYINLYILINEMFIVKIPGLSRHSHEKIM